MNVSNLGVVFAPTLSIGSVLFKALLGGYYDTVDTAESREKGLKIVWGGLLQDVEYDVTTEWPEDSTHPLQPPLTPAQEIVHASTLAIPSSNTYPQFSQSAPADHTFTAPPTSIDLALSATSATIDDEEAKLMAAMVLREELASRSHHQDDETSSNASSSSGSIPCTDTTALSAVSSPGLAAKDHAFESSFTSPSMAFSPPSSSNPLLLPSHLTSAATTTTTTTAGPSSEDIFSTSSTIPILLQDSTPKTGVSPLSPPPSLDSSSSSKAPIVHITIDAGSPLSAEFGSLFDPQQFMETAAVATAGETKEVVTEKSAEAVVVGAPVTPPVEVFHKTAAVSGGAPQLPPLEGLMIAL
jgi:hypothetical protein